MNDYNVEKAISAIAFGVSLNFTPEEMKDLINFICDYSISDSIDRIIINKKHIAKYNYEKKCWEKENETNRY